MMWTEAARTLIGFVNLTDDWDRLGTIAPKPLLILKAISLLIELEAARSDVPRVGACPMGGILFEWQWPESGIYRKAEITPAGAIEWMEERKGKPVRHGTGTPDGKIEWKETR